MNAQMSVPAAHVLSVALDAHEKATGEKLPRDGWEHFFTSLGDDGRGAFQYDRAPEDGAGWLLIRTAPHGIDWQESFVSPEARATVAP